ncbi:MAG: methylated-DNA--[protein]-cysteine S-methyltransferase [Eubacterium sp.]|nr:methylated-DNA--[protein]-cysteine S-methyltransferase [Eubacterium sp.]
MVFIDSYESPLGPLTAASDGVALTGLWFNGQKYFASTLTGEYETRSLPVFERTREWLDLYFLGKAPDFMPPFSVSGTKFRKEVWELLLQIPYGQTTTYGELAKKLAARRNIARMSAQAVGSAVGHNPVSILIPCHRVIGSDGSLTGYAGGIEKKAALLALESEEAARQPAP